MRDVCVDLFRHPVRHLIHRWNWKQAVFVAAIRGGLFFGTNLTHGWSDAWHALAVDAVFRVPLAGVYPAVTQALRGAEPAWAAVAVNLIVLPAVAHLVEFAVHSSLGTTVLGISMVASVALSVFSTLFTVFAMTRGLFLVGESAQPFRDDLARLPSLVAEFVLAPRKLLDAGIPPERRRDRKSVVVFRACIFGARVAQMPLHTKVPVIQRRDSGTAL